MRNVMRTNIKIKSLVGGYCALVPGYRSPESCHFGQRTHKDQRKEGNVQNKHV